MNYLSKIVLFSGRFDRPNFGHAITIMRLGQMFKKVIVPVLDYKEQEYCVTYRVNLLKDLTSMAKGNYDVFANKEHFAYITLDEIKKYSFDIYCSSNHACLRNIEKLGYETLYVDRSYDYNSTSGRLKKKIMEVL